MYCPAFNLNHRLLPSPTGNSGTYFFLESFNRGGEEKEEEEGSIKGNGTNDAGREETTGFVTTLE